MSQARSYYDLLGVDRAATTEEIREAYVRLMKRHHPDAAAPGDGAADLAPLLNRCYAVLRDPGKRSKYDAKLRASSPMNLAPPRTQYPAATSERRRWGRPAVLVGAVAVAASWIVLSVDPEGPARVLADSAAGWVASSPSRAASTVAPLPDPQVAERMADFARTISFGDAEHFSRECFASAKRLDPLTADSCVLFDVAFLYWHKTPGAPSTFPAYFADQVVHDRHGELTIAHGTSAEQRLSSLQAMAFQALMRAFEVPSPELMISTPARNHALMPPELREGERERLAAAKMSQNGAFSP